MDHYETFLRAVFPRLYAAALEVCETAEEAALIAQVALLRSYRVGFGAPASERLVAEGAHPPGA